MKIASLFMGMTALLRCNMRVVICIAALVVTILGQAESWKLGQAAARSVAHNAQPTVTAQGLQPVRLNRWIATSIAFGAFAASGSPVFAANAGPAPATTQAASGLRQGRLLKCLPQSNCISTSSVNSVDKYSRPWEFTADPDEEFKQIVSAVSSDKFLKLVEQDDKQHYLRAEAKSAVPPTGVDDIEFLINDRDKIITYRSNSREIIKAGSQVVSDVGSNKNRLDGIKRKLGVQEMGMTDETVDYIKENEKVNFIERIQKASLPNEINFIDNSVPDDELKK